MRFTFNNKQYTHVQKEDFLSDMLEDEGEIANLDFLSDRFNTYTLENYLQYTRSEDFEMNEEIAKTFDFMGVINHNNYPLDYWKCKLLDNKVRESNANTKLYDVTEYWPQFSMEILTALSNSLPKNVYLAGASLMACLIPNFGQSDDEFVIDFKKDNLINTINYYCPINSINLYTVGDSIKDIDKLSEDSEDYIIVSKTYESKEQIVYSFNIDSTALILVDDKIYSNACGKYSLEHRINHFDASNYGLKYINRLIKYTFLKFDIELPQYDENKIDFDMISTLFAIYNHKIALIVHPFVKLVIAKYYLCNSIECMDENLESLDVYTHHDDTEKDSIIDSNLFDNNYYGKEFNSYPKPTISTSLIHPLVGKDISNYNREYNSIYSHNNELIVINGYCCFPITDNRYVRDDKYTLFICREEELSSIKKQYR